MGTQESLLAEFIKQKKESYQEPVFKGPTPGGFSAKKYTVSLFTALTNYEQRWIAEKSGVGHALLRKWRTEEAYKRVEHRHRQEFYVFFFNKVEETRKQTQKMMVLANVLFAGLVEDFKKYSSPLKKQIINTCQNPGNLGEMPFYKRFGQVLSLQDEITKIKNSQKVKSLNAEIDREFETIYLLTAQDSLHSMASELEHRRLSKKEAYDIGHNLRWVAMGLGFYTEEKEEKRAREKFYKEYDRADEEGKRKMLEEIRKRIPEEK